MCHSGQDAMFMPILFPPCPYMYTLISVTVLLHHGLYCCWHGLARQHFDTTSCTASRMRVDGLTVEQLREHFSPEGWAGNQKKMAPQMTATLLEGEEEEDCMMYHMHITTPMVLSNRSLFVAQYRIEQPDGKGYTWIMSSRGNEALQEKYASRASRDVIANMIIQYWHAEATERGVCYC